MASFGSTVLVGWLAALLAGLTTVSAEATYTVSGHDNPGHSRWYEPRVVIIADHSLNLISPDAVDALERAVQTWQAALEYGPTLEVVRGNADGIGYSSATENDNTVRFAPYGEPLAQGALAITVLTCDDRGEIVDADIVLNGIYRFGDSADSVPEGEHCPGSCFPGSRHTTVPTWDLQGLLTHEMGHFLGLKEDYFNADATLFAYSLPGDIGKRDLAAADLDAIEAAYPAPAPDVQGPGCAGASITGQTGRTGAWRLLGTLSVFVMVIRRAPVRGAKTAE